MSLDLFLPPSFSTFTSFPSSLPSFSFLSFPSLLYPLSRLLPTPYARANITYTTASTELGPVCKLHVHSIRYLQTSQFVSHGFSYFMFPYELTSCIVCTSSTRLQGKCSIFSYTHDNIQNAFDNTQKAVAIERR
uniref:Uncharacterized protein n=1 Tax=Cacopsylla melanoneura TaxID=428564 RepID=A0A8D9FGB9_9HEMI